MVNIQIILIKDCLKVRPLSLCVCNYIVSLENVLNSEKNARVKLVFKANEATFSLDETSRKVLYKNSHPDCASYEEYIVDVDNFTN